MSEPIVLSEAARALGEAMEHLVEGCHCSDERWLCPLCLEACAAAVLSSAESEELSEAFGILEAMSLVHAIAKDKNSADAAKVAQRLLDSVSIEDWREIMAETFRRALADDSYAGFMPSTSLLNHHVDDVLQAWVLRQMPQDGPQRLGIVG